MFKLVRSMLFTPADRFAALEKGLKMATLDVMVVDMEDAVANTASAKETARLNVHKFMSENVSAFDPSRPRPRIVVRCNGLGSDGVLSDSEMMRDDLQCLRELSLNMEAVLLPKAESEEVLAEAFSTLNKGLSIEKKEGHSLWAMIETPRGVQRVDGIAEMPEIDALVFGSNDLTKELKAGFSYSSSISRQPLWYSMGKTIAAARANDKLVIDGVYMNLDDGEKNDSDFLGVCVQGKEMGFDGKSLIHPKQVELCNTAFSPSEADVLFASKVVSTYNDIMEEYGEFGVTKLDGRLVEMLHVDHAKSMLAVWADIERKDAAAAKGWVE